MQEEWRDIEGYEGAYQVSNLGHVRSLDRMCRNGTKKNGEYSYNLVKGRVLKVKPDNNGYLRVSLSKNHKGKSFGVHRLVALAFIPNPDNKPEVNHTNGDKTDNSVDNLEWCTREENMQHAYDTGLRDGVREIIKENNKKYKSKMVICNETGEIFDSTHEAHRITGVAQHHICNCCNNKEKSAGKFIDPDGNVVKRTWRYLEE